MSNSEIVNEYDDVALPIPPLDPYALDLGIGDKDDVSFEFTFDDHYFPSETEDFLAEFFTEDPTVPDNNYPSPESGNSNDFSNDSSKNLNSLSSELFESIDNKTDNNCSNKENDNLLDFNNINNKNEVVSEPVSSQSSGNGVSCDSPDCNSGKDLSSSNIGCKVKSERKCFIKRKKEDEEEEENVESRSTKFHRSSLSVDNSVGGNNNEDEKRMARLMRNRESAQLSRQRKKHYVEELEDKVRSMHSAIADLNSKISFFMAENASLRQQLGGGVGVGMCPVPPPGMYAPHPMAYPWMPYVVKPQGSQVPLVPIPRLKTQQQPAPAASRPKKSESKKTEDKTKKVASVSFLGLLFFIFLFGVLVPLVNNKYGGSGDEIYSQHLDRILTVSGNRNGSSYTMDPMLTKGNEKFDFKKRVLYERGKVGEKVETEQKKQESDGCVQSGNLSEPLVASLYVPRNDKLVKIDGNLIIHSVLASEKAMASHKASATKESDKTGLAIATNLAPAWAYSEAGRNRGRHPQMYRNPNERQRALASGSADPFKDHAKSTSVDGKLQQWFREGLAGPMLSSGMCTEVFQFDVSPAANPGGVIPAPPVNNSSADHHQNSTNPNKGKNRRILHGLPLPLNKSTLNISEEHVRNNSHKENFSGHKSRSPMVVSVLVDPREAGDGEGDGVMGPTSLSRIFVVVLMDSVKYVTYSCMLPLMGSGPHLTT